MLRQQKPSGAILSVLKRRGRISHRQAYRYLHQARGSRQTRPVPEAKAIFTVHLPRRLIQRVRTRCRQEACVMSHVVAQLLERWLAAPRNHG